MTSDVFSTADSKGRNALMLASLYGKSEVVQVLLESILMNPEIFERTDSHGQNALMIASIDIFSKGTKAVEFLLDSRFMRPEVLERTDNFGSRDCFS